MAQKDAAAKKFISDSENFADIFNFYLYDGEQVITPESLRELDTTLTEIPYGDSFRLPVQRLRDVVKIAEMKTDGKSAYVILGVENQAEINNAMVLRNMLYDVLSYTSQAEKIAKSHENNGDKTKTRAEFLSGLHDEDRLFPVITLVLYLKPERWTAPRSLHEMLSVKDRKLLRYVSDYKLNVISPYEMSGEDLTKFKSELGVALEFIKYSKDKKSLRRALDTNPRYTRVKAATAMFMSEYTGLNVRINKDREVVDMCQAIREMIADGVAEGRTEGRAEGQETQAKESAAKLYKRQMALDEIAEIVNYPVSTIKAWLGISPQQA